MGESREARYVRDLGSASTPPSLRTSFELDVRMEMGTRKLVLRSSRRVPSLSSKAIWTQRTR